MSTERLECRVKPEMKQIIQKAADIMGMSLSDFVINAATLKAYEFMRDHNIINANMEQMEEMVQSILKARKNHCENCGGTGYIYQGDLSEPVRCGYNCQTVE